MRISTKKDSPTNCRSVDVEQSEVKQINVALRRGSSGGKR